MRNYLLLAALGALLLFACDKATSTSTKLSGEWQLTSYKLTVSNGMSYIGSGEGALFFSDLQTETSDKTYLFQLNQTVNGAVMVRDESGTFLVSYEQGFPELSLTTSSGSPALGSPCRILTLNKTDLQLEGSDSLGRIHTFLFRKVK
jgi:outer membrane protein assembly factor BamB